MPLDSSTFSSARPSGSPSNSVIPIATVPAPGEAADALRLVMMPTEILIRISSFLRPNDALALSRGCWTIFQALHRDVVEPLRLGGRIRWVNSLTGMQAAIRDVLAAPADRRGSLFDALYKRVEALHPDLQGPSRQQLAPYREAPPKHWWDELYAPTDPARERLGWAHRIADCHGELLDRVLASSPQARVRLLLWWFGEARTPSPPVSEWGRIVSALPPNGRGKVLALMARQMPPRGEYGEPTAILLAAVRKVANPDAPVPADHADVLKELAGRLLNSRYWQPTRFAENWTAIDELARRLPLQSQPKVLAELAKHVPRHGVASPDQPARPRPRGQEFIEYVCAHFPPSDVVMILATFGEHTCEAQYEDVDDDVERPIREAILHAAQGLPIEWRATLLARFAQKNPHSLGHEVELWDDAFLASASVPQPNAAALYRALAAAVHCLDRDVQDNRWHALVQRVETAVNPDAMLPILLELADNGRSPLEPGRHAALAAIAPRLPTQDRGLLSAAMVPLDHADITPQRWRMQMTELEHLPPMVLHASAELLASLLFDAPDDGAFAPASDELAPSPEALHSARMPRTLGEALGTVSKILTLLPPAHRGAVLLKLSPMRSRWTSQPIPWSLTRARWLLEEALKLAPLQHHGIGVVANVSSVVAQRCPNEADARSLLPLLERAVHALPAEARASPLFFLGSLIERLLNDPSSRDGWVAELSAIPAEDAAVAIGLGKRQGASG
jgi:hypothetical protein